MLIKKHTIRAFYHLIKESALHTHVKAYYRYYLNKQKESKHETRDRLNGTT